MPDGISTPAPEPVAAIFFTITYGRVNVNGKGKHAIDNRICGCYDKINFRFAAGNRTITKGGKEMDSRLKGILGELKGTLGKIDEGQAAQFAQMVHEAPRIFLAGCGRSGLMVRAFAMRCMHMGKTAYVLGDVTTPSIRKGDLLVIASGSGETESLVSHANKAKKLGAKIATVTIYPRATIGRMADCAVWINAPTAKSEEETGVSSIQPMGSLFEQSLLLFLDGAIVRMMELSGISSEEMFKNHANLE